MRALGLDLGDKTIGMAVSDELGLAAHPRETHLRRGPRSDLEAIAAVVAAEGITVVVVGLPLLLSGEAGPRARKTLAFAEALRAHIGVPVESWDERFSTVAAERVLLEGNVRRARRREVIDKQAAAYILQGWLDARRDPG